MIERVELALLDDGPMPLELRLFLMVVGYSGQAGLGYQAVFGDDPLIHHLYRFELFWEMQQLVVLASSEEGRQRLSERQSIRAAIHAPDPASIVIPTDVPFDPERMSPEQVQAYFRNLYLGTGA